MEGFEAASVQGEVWLSCFGLRLTLAPFDPPRAVGRTDNFIFTSSTLHICMGWDSLFFAILSSRFD